MIDPMEWTAELGDESLGEDLGAEQLGAEEMLAVIRAGTGRKARGVFTLIDAKSVERGLGRWLILWPIRGYSWIGSRPCRKCRATDASSDRKARAATPARDWANGTWRTRRRCGLVCWSWPMSWRWTWGCSGKRIQARARLAVFRHGFDADPGRGDR